MFSNSHCNFIEFSCLSFYKLDAVEASLTMLIFEPLNLIWNCNSNFIVNCLFDSNDLWTEWVQFGIWHSNFIMNFVDPKVVVDVCCCCWWWFYCSNNPFAEFNIRRVVNGNSYCTCLLPSITFSLFSCTSNENKKICSLKEWIKNCCSHWQAQFDIRSKSMMLHLASGLILSYLF